MRRLAALAVVALTLLACGGDDDGAAEASGDDHAAQLEEACDARDVAINDVLTPIPDEQDAAYQAAAVEGSVPVIRDYLAAVEAIGPPGGDLDDEYDAYVTLLTDTLERYEDAVGDPDKIAAVFNQPAPRFGELEQALGMTTCGVPGNGTPAVDGEDDAD